MFQQSDETNRSAGSGIKWFKRKSLSLHILLNQWTLSKTGGQHGYLTTCILSSATAEVLDGLQDAHPVAQNQALAWNRGLSDERG